MKMKQNEAKKKKKSTALGVDFGQIVWEWSREGRLVFFLLVFVFYRYSSLAMMS